jgi:hypothetical protein
LILTAFTVRFKDYCVAVRSLRLTGFDTGLESMTRYLLVITVFFFAAGTSPVVSAAAAAAGLDEGLAAIRSGDYRAALLAFRPLARQGDARAQYQLGQMYSQGRGAPKDYERAGDWYRKAAEQGHVEAQFDLGALYRRGVGVAHSNELAVKWWLKAADTGDSVAQSALGDMYLDGVGVPRDIVQAYKWYMLSMPRSAKGRVQWGAINMRGLTKRLTNKQRGVAQRAVRKWIAAHKLSVK